MPTTPPTILPALAPFAPLVSRRVRRRALVPVVGAIPGPGPGQAHRASGAPWRSGLTGGNRRYGGRCSTGPEAQAASWPGSSR